MAVNNNDPNDAKTNIGFMTLKPYVQPTNVSIISTGNDGKYFGRKIFLK